MALQRLQRRLQNVGDDLHPEAALAATVRDEIAARRVPHVAEHLDVMGDRIGVALEQGAPEMREAMRERDAEKDAALRGEILLMTSDLAREEGNLAAARPPLNDVNLRKALCYAFDYDGFINNILSGSVTRNAGITGPTSPTTRNIAWSWRSSPGVGRSRTPKRSSKRWLGGWTPRRIS